MPELEAAAGLCRSVDLLLLLYWSAGARTLADGTDLGAGATCSRGRQQQLSWRQLEALRHAAQQRHLQQQVSDRVAAPRLASCSREGAGRQAQGLEDSSSVGSSVGHDGRDVGAWTAYREGEGN